MSKVRDAQTPTTTHESGGFKRTALVVSEASGAGSIDVLLPNGQRLAQINLFVVDDGRVFMADVIDVDNRYQVKRAGAFKKGAKTFVDTDALVAAHFEVTK